MASATATNYIGSNIYVKSYDHDPGATTAVIASGDGGTTPRYMDARNFTKMGVVVKPNIVGGNGVTKVELVASATVAFSSVTVLKEVDSIQADSLDDNVFLEVTDSEVAQAGETLRYVAARITHATNSDESTVTYIGVPKRPASGLTATAIA